MRIRRVLAALLGLAVLAAAAFWLRAPEVAVARIERGAAVEAVYATGTIEAVDRVEVRARVGGQLAELRVREGDAVRRGDLLARIDAKALSFDVARGQADFDAAQKRREGAPQLDALRAQAKGLEAQLAQGRADLSRAEELKTSGVQTAQQVEREKALVAGLQAQLEANLAQQRDVRIGLDADAARAQAGVATLSARFSDAEVRAPMDGVVMVRRVEQGETVLLNQPLFRVGDLGHLQVEAQVDEADVGQVRPGTSAVVRLPAYQEQLVHAHVARIAPEADRERKSFEIDLELESPPPGLRPGMTAEVNLLVRRHDGVLLAPAASVRDGALYLVASGRVRKRAVQIGIRDLSRVEVSGDVREGDLALLAPADEGARVRPRVEKLPRARPPLPSEAGLTER